MNSLNAPKNLHNEILDNLIKNLSPVAFEEVAFPKIVELKNKISDLQKKIADGKKNKDPNVVNYQDEIKIINTDIQKFKLKTRHQLIVSIEELIKCAKAHSWDMCRNNSFIYLYNGEYWKVIDKNVFQNFLGNVAEKQGIDKFSAKYFQFKDLLFKQFLSTGFLPSPPYSVDKVSINLNNGTFDITSDNVKLRLFDADDFMTYQLPFDYNPNSTAPLFQNYLNKVLPDTSLQSVIAEYLGYVFLRNGSLKLEKTLILYGSGANSKSVLFEIVHALFGQENVSNYSLQSLTDDTGYYRAMIANKLINYASEINGNLDAAIFKQLTSGEPLEARLPYGEPFTLNNYAKLVFNCNELPKDVEHTEAFFRRFLIIPFLVTIPEKDQDKELAKKIINSELSGIFNWVMEGLERLLKQKGFTHSPIVDQQLKDYKIQSDNIQQFLLEEGYAASNSEQVSLKYLYGEYKKFCDQNNYRTCANRTFSERLRKSGFESSRNSDGTTFFISK